MRERFEQQMEILHTELIELGALCEQAIGRTYEVLLEGNQRAAEEIIKKDSLLLRYPQYPLPGLRSAPYR